MISLELALLMLVNLGDFTLLKGKVNRESFQGEVLAKQLAALGAKIIISARNEQELERVKKQITDSGKHGHEGVEILPLDPSGCRKSCDFIRCRWCGLYDP